MALHKLNHPSNRHPKYVNREFSWLQFNSRVLSEASNPRNPLLERIKFLAIFESNLDEFYMVRVSGLIEQETSKAKALTPDGLTPSEQLSMISEVARGLRAEVARVWAEELRPSLTENAVAIRPWDALESGEQKALSEYFQAEVFPVLTPLMVEPTLTFPFMSNRSLNLAVELRDTTETLWARVKIPPVFNRLVPIPGTTNSFILLEDLIRQHLASLFPGVEVVSAHLFRVIRDADIEIRELEAADLIDAVEKTLRLRRFGDPVLLEVEATMPSECEKILMKGLELDEQDLFRVEGQLGMEFLWELARVNRPDLKFSAHEPVHHPGLEEPDNLFARIAERDILLHHPYDSFDPVLAFIGSGATDPSVIGVKQTLYRVGSESPVVESLLTAAEEGKQVAVMVELKARFDESNNLVWSRALERAGVHVSYGMMDMKVHCKLCLIVRKEATGIRTYCHIGTGNYNPSTSRLYTDLGLFTQDPEICQDVTELFNYLTGLSRQANYRKLLVAPVNLRDGIIDRIEREIEHARAGKPAQILFKLNSLVDTEVIDALYEASQAGVSVKLVVRGICCLRPGVSGMSANIEVRSVVGRFLEHSRVYWFENAGQPEAFIGSADMMRRNLDRRIEALVPVSEPSQIAYLRDHVLGAPLRDNQQAWICSEAGVYERIEASTDDPICSQTALMSVASASISAHGQ